jgi:regulator of cell morphogenesis and NO signaling
MMKEPLFTANNRMADLIVANHELVFTLPRFGIALGFGDHTVEWVCRENGVSAELFLMICNIYSFAGYLPERTALRQPFMDGLLPYLEAAHRYYLQERIPHIEHHLQRIAELTKSKHANLLVTFFSDYRKEVERHFVYEEQTVFPYVHQLTHHEAPEGYKIEDFRNAHSNIEDKLSDLTLLIFKYFPGDVTTNDPYSVVQNIFRLSDDLNRHTLIEERLLVPYVQYLEKKEGRL